MGSSRLLTGQHVTAMVGGTDQGSGLRPSRSGSCQPPFCRGYLRASPKISLVLALPCQMWGTQGEIMVISEAHWGHKDVETAIELLGSQQMAPTFALPPRPACFPPPRPPSLPRPTHPRKINSSALTPGFCPERKLPAQNKKSIYYYTTCLLPRLLKSQTGNQTESSLKSQGRDRRWRIPEHWKVQ